MWQSARRFLKRSALTFPDRSGLSENHQGGKTGGPTIRMRILNSRVKLWRAKKLRGYSSAGRASRSQRLRSNYAHLISRDRNRSHEGNWPNWRDLMFSQMRPKILTSGQNRWTKAVTAFSSAKSGRSEKGWGSSPVGSGGFVIQKLFVRPIVRSKAFSRRITESCSNGTIIVIIMNLCNFRFGINTHQERSGQVRLIRVVSRVEVYHNRKRKN